MTKFLGEYAAKIDDKGRVVFPSALKALVPEGSEFIIKRNRFAPCLDVFTSSEWERQSEELRSRLDTFFNPEDEMFRRDYTRGTATVVPDGKLGRISVPKRLLEHIGASKEVVFSGSGYKIEIWSRENFEKNELSDQQFNAIAQRLSQKR